MKRKKSILFMLGLGAVALLFVVLLLWPTQNRLDSFRAELRARGEKITFADLAPTYSSNVVGHSTRFTGAVNRLIFQPVNPSLFSLMKTISTTRARVIWRQPLSTDADNVGRTWEDFLGQVDQSAEALHEIRHLALTWPRGLQWAPADAIDGPPANFIALRKAAQFLSGATVAELQRGRLDAARTNIDAIIALSRVTEGTGTLVEFMIGSAIGGLAAVDSWEALQAPGWDEERLAALQRTWEAFDYLPALSRCVEIERAFGGAWFDYVRITGKDPSGALTGPGLNASGALAQLFNERLYWPAWRAKWSSHDEYLYLKGIQVTVEAVRAAPTHRSWQTLQSALTATNGIPTQNAFDRFRYPVHQMASPAFIKASQHVLVNETRRQLLVTAVSLRRWQLQHGTFPERLAELIPAFLAALPRDCMDGGVLHYRRNDDGTFTLYSVGLNGRDEDGGGDDVHWLQAE